MVPSANDAKRATGVKEKTSWMKRKDCAFGPVSISIPNARNNAKRSFATQLRSARGREGSGGGGETIRLEKAARSQRRGCGRRTSLARLC